jgi:2-polyprenyl-3-methyl-5-hydroxy-6-metoxy-1,4-benzoquinol methylase
MEKINGYSRATIEFTLDWQSNGVHHQDSLWTDQVNMWRDCFVPGLAAALNDKGEGEEIQAGVPANASPALYLQNKLVEIRPQQFYAPTNPAKMLIPHAGRFYPQGFLHGVSNVFEVSTAPARCVVAQDEKLRFDLNHPLAGHDLSLRAKVIEIHKSGVERGGRCEDWLALICDNGPGMQARYQNVATDFFSAEGRQRQDENPDQVFYGAPRMVQHLDSTARAAIRRQYQRLITPGARVLDLMGSWDSHLPEQLSLQALTVLGMNEAELAANKRASATIVHDLNHTPVIPLADNSMDAVICTASVEYLTDPLAIFAEIQRVLVPGGVLALAFSNRWFPPKAIKGWAELHEFERLGMVLEMFHQTGGFTELASMSKRGMPRPEDDPHQELPLSDPVFMAWGKKS